MRKEKAEEIHYSIILFVEPAYALMANLRWGK